MVNSWIGLTGEAGSNVRRSSSVSEPRDLRFPRAHAFQKSRGTQPAPASRQSVRDNVRLELSSDLSSSKRDGLMPRQFGGLCFLPDLQPFSGVLPNPRAL